MGNHIDGFSELTACLFELYKFEKTPQDFMDVWIKDPQYPTAFSDLQEAVVSSPMLMLINHHCPIIISADTSGKAIGYIMAHAVNPSDDSSILIKTKYHLILFGSQKLSAMEQKMCATKCELLRLVYCLHKIHHILMGKVIHVFIDHHALLYLHNLQNQNQCLTAWSLEVAEYCLEIHHCPRKLMLDSDPLSHIPTPSSEEPLTYSIQDELNSLEQLQNILHIMWASLTEEPYASVSAFLAGDPLMHLNSLEHMKIR